MSHIHAQHFGLIGLVGWRRSGLHVPVVAAWRCIIALSWCLCLKSSYLECCANALYSMRAKLLSNTVPTSKQNAAGIPRMYFECLDLLGIIWLQIICRRFVVAVMTCRRFD